MFAVLLVTLPIMLHLTTGQSLGWAAAGMAIFCTAESGSGDYGTALLALVFTQRPGCVAGGNGLDDTRLDSTGHLAR